MLQRQIMKKFYASTVSSSDPQYNSLAKPIIDNVYKGISPWAVNTSGISAQHIKGEILHPDFARQAPSAELDLGNNMDSVDLPGIDGIQLHSMSTMLIRLFADVGGVNDTALATDWRHAAQYFWPVMYDNAFAGSIGMMNPSVAGILQTQEKYSDILRNVIAYSAIDEGTRVFGDTAIRAFYNDANDLGRALSTGGASTNLAYYADDISKSFIQYAGQLALGKVLSTPFATHILEGVLKFIDNPVSGKYLQVDLSSPTWSIGSGAVIAPQYYIVDSIFESLTNVGNMLGSPLDKDVIRTTMQTLWGNNSYAVFDNVSFGVIDWGTKDFSNLAVTNGSKANLIVGGNASQTIYGSYYNDLIRGGDSNDILYGGIGNDIFIRWIGANDNFYQIKSKVA